FADYLATPHLSLQPFPTRRSSDLATREASKISLAQFSPKEYMLSHATIVASVDTDRGPGPLGRHLENGFTVDRPFADYLVTQKSEERRVGEAGPHLLLVRLSTMQSIAM